MQNGVAPAPGPTPGPAPGPAPVQDVEFSIDALPPPPSPIPGLPDLQDHRNDPEASKPPHKIGRTLERMIHSPLPPMFDSYDLEYGPVTSTEPELAPMTDDGELPRFDEINEQYDFLRRTLSHSRTRYSARFKRPHKQQASSTSEREEQTSLDQPGLRREEETQSSLDSPSRSRHHRGREREDRRVSNGGMVGQMGRRRTDAGDHPLRHRQRRAAGPDRRSTPSNSTEGERHTTPSFKLERIITMFRNNNNVWGTCSFQY